MNYNKIELNKATLHIFKTTKFKKVSIDVLLTDAVDLTNLSYRMLLSRCMESKFKDYDTKQKINKKLDMLYGANFGLSSSKIGRICYIDASIDGVNPAYLEDDKLLKEFFKFLHDVLFYPIIDKNNVDEEKRLLFDEYKFEYENKATYALIESSRIAFKDELARLKYTGEEEIVRKIKVNELKDYYKHIMENNKVDIIVCGDVDNDEIINLSKEYFDFGLKNKINPIDYEDKEIDNPNYVIDKTKSNQSQLVIKYRTRTRMNDDLDLALVLANTIFGGFSSSLLFSNVREKESLCYSISSTYSRYKGVITVTAGINAKDYDNALRVIKQEVEKMKNGDFSDELLEMARLSLISSIKKGSDSLTAIAKKIYVDELLDDEFNLYSGIEELQKISKDDVIKVFNKLELDLVYFLEGSDSND